MLENALSLPVIVDTYSCSDDLVDVAGRRDLQSEVLQVLLEEVLGFWCVLDEVDFMSIGTLPQSSQIAPVDCRGSVQLVIGLCLGIFEFFLTFCKRVDGRGNINHHCSVLS